MGLRYTTLASYHTVGLRDSLCFCRSSLVEQRAKEEQTLSSGFWYFVYRVRRGLA